MKPNRSLPTLNVVVVIAIIVAVRGRLGRHWRGCPGGWLTTIAIIRGRLYFSQNWLPSIAHLIITELGGRGGPCGGCLIAWAGLWASRAARTSAPLLGGIGGDIAIGRGRVENEVHFLFSVGGP